MRDTIKKKSGIDNNACMSYWISHVPLKKKNNPETFGKQFDPLLLYFFIIFMKIDIVRYIVIFLYVLNTA